MIQTGCFSGDASARYEREFDPNSEGNSACLSDLSPQTPSTQKARIPIALKVAAFFMLPLLIGLSALTYVMSNSYREFQQQQIKQFGALFTDQLAASAVEPLVAEAGLELTGLVKQVLGNNLIVGAALLDHTFQPITHAGVLPELQHMQFGDGQTILEASDLSKEALEPADILLAGDDEAATDSETLALFMRPVQFRGTTGGYAAVVFEHSQLTRNFDRLSHLLLGSTLLLFLSSGLIIFAISRRMLEPLQSLNTAISTMGTGKDSYIPERRNDELGQLIKSINSMSKDLAKKSQVQSALGKFMAADVAEKIIDEIDTINFDGEHVDATVLFADIVGFTEMSERMPATDISTLLNEYFGYYTACAKHYFGKVDKYMGDCVMIVFGGNGKDPEHQYHALACALLMQKLTMRMNAERRARNECPIYLRIGVNSGTMLAGLLGSKDRMEYTVIGDAVNMASRLCNEAGSGQTIIQQDLYESVSADYPLDVETSRTIKVRGKSEPATIYSVTDIKHRRRGIDDAFADDVASQALIKNHH